MVRYIPRYATTWLLRTLTTNGGEGSSASSGQTSRSSRVFLGKYRGARTGGKVLLQAQGRHPDHPEFFSEKYRGARTGGGFFDKLRANILIVPSFPWKISRGTNGGRILRQAQGRHPDHPEFSLENIEGHKRNRKIYYFLSIL